MLDKEAIQELAQAQAISATDAAIGGAFKTDGIVGLPNNFTLHDIEKSMPKRRRARGKMSTDALRDFASYVKTHAEEGATVFVSSAAMAATAVLNLGSPAAPGHADNTAVFAPPRTAAFKALLAIANGSGKTQREVAEFFEDWLTLAGLTFSADEVPVAGPQAIAAVRAITIEAARKVDAAEKSLGATRGVFESVQASSKDTLPTTISFSCEPHLGLPSRIFVLRLGVLTSDKPQVTLRIVNHEQHNEEMAAELADLVREAVAPMPVVVGSYSVGA